MSEHPLTAYLKKFKEEAKSGGYRKELNRLTGTLDISLPTLYRIGAPEGKSRRTISPIKAMTLELLTEGKVPAGTVNDDIDTILEVVPHLNRHRMLMRAAAPSTA